MVIGLEPDARIVVDALRFQLAFRAVANTSLDIAGVGYNSRDVTRDLVKFDEQMSNYFIEPASIIVGETQLIEKYEAHVDANDDLRRMVDEFSSFARLPKPVFRSEDPVDLARQALFLQEVARPDINFAFAADTELGIIACDRHQFGQAMTNVLKNATEAIEARQKQRDAGYRGRISVSLKGNDDAITVTVSDNGIGLPQDRERIVEPYVTTREKGTGLGLAIVNKIVEEHGGEMTFAAGEVDGTIVRMRFARDPRAGEHGSQAAEGSD